MSGQVRWLYQATINGEPKVSGVFDCYADYNFLTTKLSDCFRAPNWREGGVKRNEAGELTAIRLIARTRGQNLELIAQRA